MISINDYVSSHVLLRNQKYQTCIDAYNDCFESCEFCATSCLRDCDCGNNPFSSSGTLTMIVEVSAINGLTHSTDTAFNITF